MKKMSGLLVLMSIMALTFIGCSDDDTTNTEKPLDRAEKLAGTFKGDAVYKGASTVSTKVDVKVTGVNELEITVKGYQFNATTISDLVISKVNVLEQDEKNVLLEGVSISTVGGKSANVALTGSALVGGENIKLNVSVDGYNSMEYSGSRYTNGTGTELMSPVVSGICVISSKYDAATGIITYTVPADARVEDLAACEATFTISDGAIWVLKTKANAEEHKLMLKDAETSIEVTAENGDKKTYVFKREAVNTEDATISLINTYVGKLIVTVGGSANPAIENQKVFVTRTSSNRVKLVVKDFMFGGANIGDIIIDNVALYKGTDEIVLSGADKVKIKLGAEATEVLAGVSGVYSISKNGITLKIDIAVNESLSVHVDYAGSIFTDPISTQPLYVSVSHPNIINQKFEADGNITFSVNAKYADADFANLKVIIKLPEGATYKPTSADKFDFTQTTQWYTVTSADGKITKNYSITRNPLTFVNQKTYDFTNWTVGTVDPPSTAYTTPDGWQTPNAAVALIKALSVGEFYPYDGEYPVFPIDEGKVGKAAKIITLDTKGGLVGGFINAPKITAGNIYTGVFDYGAAMSPEPLNATQFGLLYDGAKPLKLKGWYKYTPGATYYDFANGVWTATKTVDEPSVSVVIYEVDDEKTFLTGLDVYKSPRIIAVGKINPAQCTEFTEFTVDIAYTKDYTPETKMYKLALIMSASKDGDKYKGAPGSVLVVDEVSLVTE